MDREDTLPWYRQFWPWFIIAVPASAVVAGFYTFWLALQTTDSLLVRPTESSLAAENEAQRLELEALINIDIATGAVVVTMSSTKPFETSQALELQMSHPTIAARDQIIMLLPAIPNTAGQPTWAGHFVDSPDGRRYITLSSGNSWRLSGEWLEQSNFRLGPTGLRSNGDH